MKPSTRLQGIALASLIAGSGATLAAEIHASVVSMTSGERAVRVEATLSQPAETTWKFFSTEDGLRCWAAPVIRLDLRIGGSLQTNYDKAAIIGDPGTISLAILNYVEKEIM